MKLINSAPRTDVPYRQPVPVRVASDQRLQECGYLIARYGVPENKVEGIVKEMDLATRTLLAMEMDARRRPSFVSDWDPTEELWK